MAAIGAAAGAQDCRVEIEKGADECPAIVQRGRSDEPSLKRHVGVTEQPRLTLQPPTNAVRSPSEARADLPMANAFHSPASRVRLVRTIRRFR